jgi:hypothetical protein
VTDDGTVMLSIQLFESDGEAFKLVSEPKILANDDQPAIVDLTSEKGSVFRIAITPHKLKTWVGLPRLRDLASGRSSA